MDRHPDSETLLAFREHRLSGPSVAEVALHLGQCAQCATVEPSAARVLLEALVSECGGEATAFQSGGYAAALRHWPIAAAVLFAVLALSAIGILLSRPAPSATPVAVRPPSVGGRDARPPQVVASLADGAGRVALLEDGTLAGVEVRSPRDAEDARAVLAGRAIAIPTFIAAMPGAVRGVDAGAHPLRAIEPFRSAVLDAHPRFSWTRIRGARSYRVAVFDADYEEIAHSEALDGTSWTPSNALPAGVDLSWHVVVETDAGEMSSTGSDRAEAVFRVLTPKEANELKGLYPDSHLLRGLLYSRYGLLHDAEREYRALAGQNPDSPIARALLRSVSRSVSR